jgi:acyl-CoA hydrolase
MEVRVKSFVERLDGKRELINTAYVTMVALGEDGRSCAVEPLAPETDEEKADFEAGRRRYLERKAAKK